MLQPVLLVLPSSFLLVLPTAAADSGVSVNHLATFDNLAISSSTTAAAIGSYASLSWQGFYLVETVHPGINQTIGVRPQSDPNTANIRLPLGLSSPSPAEMDVGSGIASFDLKSFWWGCTKADKDDPVATSCTIRAVAYRGETRVVTHETGFPAESIIEDMVHATLGELFTNLTRVTIEPLAAHRTVVMDNFAYVTYTQ